MKQQDIHGSILAIMDTMRQQGSSPGRLKNYQNSYNVLERYLAQSGITHIDESICLEYVYHKTGKRFDRFECVTSDSKVDNRMRPLLLLLRYQEDGQFHGEARRIKPIDMCPDCFSVEYDAFCEELDCLGYSKATITQNSRYAQLLIMHLAEHDVSSSEEITLQHIEKFLKTYDSKSVKFVGTILYVLRKYFTFLLERGFITEDLVAKLPKVRAPRNAGIPYVWSKEDIQKLLGAIDREDPKGKRDYAMLLIAIRLGLRISDIRTLKQSSINWNRQIISLKMLKTGQLIELPLLKDVGWAIIDYLKNGRPATNSECVFVRHRAPFNAIGGAGSFTKELHRYIVKADLQIPDGQRRGMHSLRSTLAANMLEIKSPLPIISETLGHQSINTTGIYLKIDLDGLRKCALDPEEVFFHENTL